jgi:hypothetical protein
MLGIQKKLGAILDCPRIVTSRLFLLLLFFLAAFNCLIPWGGQAMLWRQDHGEDFMMMLEKGKLYQVRLKKCKS